MAPQYAMAAEQSEYDGPRALLTPRERDIISGRADDVSDSYRYQTISRVRKRFRQIEADMMALDEHGELGDEVRAMVCPDSEHEPEPEVGIPDSEAV